MVAASQFSRGVLRDREARVAEMWAVVAPLADNWACSVFWGDYSVGWGVWRGRFREKLDSMAYWWRRDDV